MDKDMICRNAGIIRKLVSSREKEHWSYEELKAATGLRDRELNAAIGWLARENDIEMDCDTPAGKERFYLSMNYYF